MYKEPWATLVSRAGHDIQPTRQIEYRECLSLPPCSVLVRPRIHRGEHGKAQMPAEKPNLPCIHTSDKYPQDHPPICLKKRGAVPFPHHQYRSVGLPTASSGWPLTRNIRRPFTGCVQAQSHELLAPGRRASFQRRRGLAVLAHRAFLPPPLAVHPCAATRQATYLLGTVPWKPPRLGISERMPQRDSTPAHRSSTVSYWYRFAGEIRSKKRGERGRMA